MESVATQLYVPSSERVTGHSSSVDRVKLIPPTVIGSVYTVATSEELVTGSEFLNQVMSGKSSSSPRVTHVKRTLLSSNTDMSDGAIIISIAAAMKEGGRKGGRREGII